MVIILFCRGCIIEADKNDDQSDRLTKEEIKQINLNLEDAKFDIQHDKEPITGCRIIENAIHDESVIIDNTTLNPGSWVVTIEVDNPELESQIQSGFIKGFSLFSYAEGATSYNEVADKSEIYPIFISFVNNPSNHIIFEVLDRDQYISKSSDNMADDKGLIQKIKELIASEESPEDNKADNEAPADSEATKPKAPAESPADAKEDEVKKACDTEDEVKKEADAPAGNKMETQENGSAQIIKLLEEVLSRLPAQEVEKSEEEPAEEKPAEEKYIVKQATQKGVNKTSNEQSKPLFDLFGRKL